MKLHLSEVFFVYVRGMQVTGSDTSILNSDEFSNSCFCRYFDMHWNLNIWTLRRWAACENANVQITGSGDYSDFVLRVPYYIVQVILGCDLCCVTSCLLHAPHRRLHPSLKSSRAVMWDCIWLGQSPAVRWICESRVLHNIQIWFSRHCLEFLYVKTVYVECVFFSIFKKKIRLVLKLVVTLNSGFMWLA